MIINLLSNKGAAHLGVRVGANFCHTLESVIIFCAVTLDSQTDRHFREYFSLDTAGGMSVCFLIKRLKFIPFFAAK